MALVNQTQRLMGRLETAKLRAQAAGVPSWRAEIDLYPSEYVMSPAHTDRKVFGPGRVILWGHKDGGLDMNVVPRDIDTGTLDVAETTTVTV